MAPSKFEKHIKKELEEREITPSVHAWERLSEKLETTAPQPKKKGYFWYGIAASFIGILIVSIAYFNSEINIEVPDAKFTDTTEEVIEVKSIPDSKIANEMKDAVVEQTKKKKLTTTNLNENQAAVTRNEMISLKEIQSVNEAQKSVNNFEEEIINTKILQIVATVDSIEQHSAALTNAEVDNLLRIAQEEILRDKLINQNGSVDAIALLTEAENELDKSFRDQVFDSLKSGFLKVRTAVADRNK